MTNSTSIHTQLRYVSSPYGSGKTTALCNMINKKLNIRSSAEKFIIVQNTQKLANQTTKDIDNCEIIISTSKSRKKNVINSVLDFLKKPTKRALIITDKTFFRIPVERLQGWQIWLDDVTNFHSYKCINDSSPWLKPLFTVNSCKSMSS